MYADVRDNSSQQPPHEVSGQDHEEEEKGEGTELTLKDNAIISEDQSLESPESSSSEEEEEGIDGGEEVQHDGTYEYGYRHPPGGARGAHRQDYGYMNHIYGGSFNDSEYVMVDAHILASPVLADINGDGDMEVSSSSKAIYIILYYI